jgi:hypothetical protein
MVFHPVGPESVLLFLVNFVLAEVLYFKESAGVLSRPLPGHLFRCNERLNSENIGFVKFLLEITWSITG